MAVATGGVILVLVSEQRDVHNPPLDKGRRNRGLLFALMSALFLAAGMIFSKRALEDGMGALALAFYRNALSTGVIWVAALTRGAVRPALGALRADPGVVKLFLLGCVFGPAGGIWLSCEALEYLPARASMLGAVVACAGAAILLSR